MQNTYSKKDFAIDLLYDVIGSIIYSVGINCFAKPGHFATGGLSGLSLILNYVADIPLGISQIIMNLPLALISFKILGKFFIFRTVKTMIIMSAFMDILAPILPQYAGDKIICALFAGVLNGIGLAIMYFRGGSTGGLDFIIMSIRKKKPHLSLGKLSMIFNGIILIIGVFAFKDIDAALYGAIAIFASGTIVDHIMNGLGAGKMLIIITNKGQEISSAIHDVTGHGSSIMSIKGSYSKDDKQMVISAMNKNHVFPARKIAHSIDPTSFVMVTSTDEVFGKGFNTQNIE